MSTIYRRTPALAMMAALLAMAFVLAFGGDASAEVLVKQGMFTKTSGTVAVNQIITGVGFQPKAVIFYWTRQTNVNANNAGLNMGYGFAADGAPITMGSISTQGRDNQATTDTNTQYSSAYAIVMKDWNAAGGPMTAQASVTSFDLDGFTLNWQTNEARADYIHYIAIGGSDVTNAKVGTFIGPDLPTAVFGVTGVGFTPDSVMLIGGDRTGTALDTNYATGTFNLGFMTTAAQASVGYGARDAQTGVSVGHAWSNTQVITGMRRNGIDQMASYVSMDADGFTLNFIDSGGFARYFYLALKGGQHSVGDFTKRTSAGAQSVTTPGFPPVGVQMMSISDNVANNTARTVDPAANLSIGSADSPTSYGSIWSHYRAVVASDANTFSYNNLVMRMGLNTNGTVTDYGQATFTGFTSTGFDLNWTSSDTTARNIIYWAIGNPPPTVSNAAPGSVGQTETWDVVLTGTHFHPGATVVVSGTGVTVNSTTVDSETQITANVTVDVAAPLGARDVTVTNTDGQSATLVGGLTVTTPCDLTPSTITVLGSQVANGDPYDATTFFSTTGNVGTFQYYIANSTSASYPPLDHQQYFDSNDSTCDYTGWTATIPDSCGTNVASANQTISTHTGAAGQDNADGTHTVSAGTGPTSLHSGTHGANGGFIYKEESGGTYPEAAEYFTYDSTFSADQNYLNISFAYSAFGTGTGTVGLEINNGTGWTREWEQTGNDGNAGAWTPVSIDLYNGTGMSAAKYQSGNIQVRFVWENASAWANDWAIDTIRVFGGGRTMVTETMCTNWTTGGNALPASTAGGSACGDFADGGSTHTINVRGTDPDCGGRTINSSGAQNFTWNACSDSDPTTAFTITAPVSSETVKGAYLITATVAGEATPGVTNSSATVTLTGTTGGTCDLTGAAMAWNGAQSRWELTWNNALCGDPAENPITIDATYVDPDCFTPTNATQVTNITLNNVGPKALAEDGAPSATNTNVAPGGSAQFIDAFDLSVANWTGAGDDDTVTSVTFTLDNAAHAAYVNSIGIYDEATMTFLGEDTTPTAGSFTITGLSIAITDGTVTKQQLKAYAVPGSHASMGAVPGAIYNVSGHITGLTHTNGTNLAGSTDGVGGAEAFMNIDNLSTAAPTGLAASSGEYKQSVLTWTDPGDGDLAQVVVIYDTVTITAAPTEGATYIAGDTVSGGTKVGCVAAPGAQTCTATNLGGVTYYFKAFAKDSNGNYSVASNEPTGTPTGPVYVVAGCVGCHNSPPADSPTGVRNTPTGAVKGDHDIHATGLGLACTECHVDNGVDTAHRNGNIEMSALINGSAASSYDRGTSFAQDNNPTTGNCNNTYCHSNGTSVATGTSPVLSNSPQWGVGTTVCTTCHSKPPAYVSGAPKANSHSVHTTNCSVCHNATTSDGGNTITGPANHGNAAYNVIANSSQFASYTFNIAGGTCNTVCCHGDGSPQWGGTQGCLDCHAGPVCSPNAEALDPTVTTRRSVVGEFGMTWSHKRTAGGTVTNNDCGVCHMEGTAADGTKNATYHGNGYVELRDPDLGTTIKTVTFAGTPGNYTSTGTDALFVRFSRDLSTNILESAVTAIQQNQCIKCHDGVGAASALAQVPGGSALRPFATAPTHTPGNNVLNVAAHFATTNRSYHPVLGKQNNSYSDIDLMWPPFNQTARTAGSITQWGDLISCWDCHAADGTPSTAILTNTVTAHGGLTTLRGASTVSGTPSTTNAATLCMYCHDTTTYNQATPGHGPNSAASNLNRTQKVPFLQYGCNVCHSSGYNTPATRPTRSEDVHGTNTLPTTGQTLSGRWSTDPTPIAFIRNRSYMGNHSPLNVGGTGYSPQCNMLGTDGNGVCTNQGAKTYTVGGTY